MTASISCLILMKKVTLQQQTQYEHKYNEAIEAFV